MWRPFEIVRAALAAETANPAIRRNASEAEFLPAALEITETPASPTLRILSLALCGFMTFLLGWSIIGKVDVVATAEGRIIPSGHSKLVQPLETGIVRAIHVREGARVKAGDILVELDSTGTGAERERLYQLYVTADTQAARLRALLAARSRPQAIELFRLSEGTDEALVKTQRRLLESEFDEQQARIAQLLDEIQRRRAEASTVSAGIRRLDQTIPLLAERVSARRELAEKGYGSRLQFLELEEQRIASEQERVIQRLRLAETSAAIVALESQSRTLDAEFRRQKGAELAEAEVRAAAALQELIKAEQRHSQQSLAASIDGQIQQLSVSTVGGVVTPAQNLMVIVPDGEELEIEARVLNKDIGFVRAGQRVELKIETFLFTRYGLIEGVVTNVSRDAIVDERQIPTFATRIRPSRTTMSVEGRDIPLTAGMTTTAEIKIGSRRVIDFLLSPFLRYRHEAFREN